MAEIKRPVDTGVNKIIIYILLLSAATAVFRLFNLDIAIQSMLYDFTAKSWKYAYHPAVLWMYKYGTYPAVFLAAAAIAVFFAGFIYEKMKKHRKASLLIILTMLIAPGVITNLILKNYTGRPRPRDVVEFNGTMNFKQPLELGIPGKGFSFPCGHCTMGFFFYAAYLILRKKNAAVSFAVLGGSLLYGTAMGFGRMAQGGHFASDVIWAAAITLITAEVLHVFVVRTNDGAGLFENIKVKNKALVFGAALSLLVIAALFFLIATPYNKYREYSIGQLTGSEITSDRANIFVEQSGQGIIKFSASGFGLPWADYDDMINTDSRLIYTANSRGLFSELNSSIKAYLPQSCMRSTTITAGTGDISFAPKGDLLIKNLYIITEKGGVYLELPAGLKFMRGALIVIKAPKGHVVIRNLSKYYKDLNSSAESLAGSKEVHVKPLIAGEPGLSITAQRIHVETGME
jgi:membrane-associated PAP2 superfamily phosphatase